MTDAVELKNEIDKNQNGIEAKEIEEFLQSEENIKKLGEALNSNIDSTLLDEFHTAISELCDKMPKIEKCTLNQYKIILFYLNNFEPIKPILNPNDKLVKIYNKVMKNWENAMNDYFNQLKKKPFYDIKGPIAELRREETDITRILQKGREGVNKTTEELKAKGEFDPGKRSREIINGPMKEKEKKAWEADKQKIQAILDKEGTFTEDEKNELLKFKSRYYFYHENYDNPQDLTLRTSISMISSFRPSEEYDEIAAKIDKKINAGSFNYINDIISKEEIPQKIDIKGLGTINQWVKEFGNTTSENREIKKKIGGIILKKIETISKTFKEKDVDKVKLDKTQIGIFQLRANIEYGEDLEINGIKSALNSKTSTVTEGEITALYIYRKRLSIRDSKNYENILEIPDIDNLLYRLGSKEKEHTVFKDFLTFFFRIQKSGIKFEDKIGSEAFKNLLENMVSAEFYRGKSVESEIKKWEYIKTYAEIEGCKELISQSEEIINYLNKIPPTEDLGDYYENIYKQQKTLIQKQHDINIKDEQDRKKREEINKIIIKINKDYNNIQKYKENKREYREKFKPIAQNFINSRKNNKNLYSESILPSQIFTEIYCLWGEDTKSVFSPTILQECKKYKNQLDCIAEAENKHIERVADTYHLVTEINELINKGHLQIYANSYDVTRKRSEYIKPKNICVGESTNVVKYDPLTGRRMDRQAVDLRLRNGHTIQIEEIIHIDTYNVPGYEEKHETVVQMKDSDGRILTYHGYGTKDYNPFKQLVGPNPNGRYAIIPDRLKSKANQGKIKFGIINNVAYMYEFEQGGDIKMYEYNKRTKTFSKTPKIITQGEYTKALTIESNRYAFREAEHGEEYKKVLNDFKEIVGKNDDLEIFMGIRENEKLDKIGLYALQNSAVTLYNLTEKFVNNRNKIIQIKNTLIKLNKNTNNYENPYEKQIRESIEALDQILGFATQEQLKQAAEFKDFCLNHVDNNETIWARRKQRLPTALAFIAAIAIMVASGGSLSIFSCALLSSTTGVAVEVVTTMALNKRTGYDSTMVDGVEYQTHYTNPTLIEQAFDPNSDTTLRDCIETYGSEIIIGTFLQAALMGTGGWFSKYFSKMIAKTRPGSFARKAENLICTVLCKERVKSDAFTEGLIKSVEKQVTKKGFIKQFQRELVEETREEGVEQAAESQGAILGAIATFIHCIKPHPGQSLQLAGVGYPKIEPPISMGKGKSKLIAQATYDGTNPDNITILKNYYESIPEYKGKVSIEEGGIIKISATNIKGGEIEIDGEKIQTNMDVELEFRPSKAPLAIRNMPTELNNLGSIITNEETGEVGYGSKVQLRALGVYLEDQGLGSVVINKDGTATLTIGKEKINLIKDESYIDGKSHMYNISPEQVYSNSEYMDQILHEIGFDINGEKLGKILENLLGKINERYKEATQLNEGLNLSKEQLLSIIEAHKQDGKLGNLNPAELTNKYNILYNAKIEKDTIRFLFEAGFCGSLKLGTDNIGDIKRLNQQEIQQLIDGKSELKIEEMTLNDLNVLMWKAANMGLNTDTIRNVMKKIGERIKNIKEGGNYNKEHMEQLEENIAQISFEVEIKGIEINDPDFDAKINEIEGEINNRFGESKTGKELKVELDKKKFEYYKVNGESLKANLTVNEMESLNKSLLSEDITNFKYKRGLLDVELYKIQLGIGNIETMKKNAEELREDSDCIGGRTDINTLLSKIEAGILLGKPQKQLDAYLSYLAIQEHEVGVNILGNVFGTISNTFPEQELDASAERMENAGKASENSDLKNKGERARKIAEDYKETKKKLEGDKNDVEKKKLQDIIDESVYLTPIKSITDIGNTFINPLQLFNYGTVASVEITENTYSKTHEILTGNKEVNGVKIEGGIDMEGNRDPSKSGFREYMKNLNEKFDGFIRTLYSTQKLQELNSASHSSGYDANMKSYLEQVGLNDLAQIMEIYGIADCRVHAFTKQILFDTMKRTQLQNLNKKLNDPNTSKEDKQRIEKQIKILKNTKMVYIDTTLTGNVRMRGKYVKEGDGHFVEGNENAIIEEHTYNLLEIPTIDSEGNITYNKGEMAREVYYADSFYQGHMVEVIDKDGNTIEGNSVYDLSYNGETDIGETIYGRTYYSKKNGKYVNDPKINMSMSTEVITPDGKVLPITSVPLFRSVQGRGNNLTPSNVEPEVLKPDEVKKRNSETEAHVEAIDKLNTARSEISHTMKEALKNGEIEKLEDMLNNGIGTAMHFNVETGTRETGSRLIIINETQAKFLKRAIDICKNYNGNIPINMQESLNTMFDHIVTEEEVDYRKKSGENSDVEERMGIFWDNIQVFNEVYKSRVEDAMKNLNPNDEASIQRLENAIKDFKKIYDEDMKEFHKRNQDMMLKENKWNETYHRNNFEHVAKRFQSDMETYGKVVESLEKHRLYEQAFELKKYMVDQGNTLLDHSDELLGHMIDFKKVKKEMKGIKGREIYNQLKEIQGKEIQGNEKRKEEFEKSGLDWNYIKEMTGMDKDAQLNEDNLKTAIENIEESGLKKYYEVIELVFNPELMAINMENAVYSSDPIYTSETDNGRTFSTETKEEYTNRKKSQEIFENNVNDETPSNDIKGFCDGIVDRATQKLAGNEASQIKTTISELITLCKDNGIKGKAMYDLCKMSTEALVFQTIESKTRSMGDHGINHISGNIQKLNTYLEAAKEGKKIPEAEIGKYKLMGALTHIFHDIGYAAIISRGSNSFDGSKIHPFTSKMFFDAKIANILVNAGIKTELISMAIESHDGIRLNWGTAETTFLSMVNLSDNMGLGVDKIAEIWSNPHLLRHIATLYALDASGIDIKKSHEIMINEINNDNKLNDNQKETLKSAIKEISAFSMGNVDFWSISPLTTMEFGGDVPTLSMYQGANRLLVAEVCGIDKAKLETAIKQYENGKKTNNKQQMEEARTAVIELIKGPDGKGTKFCSQIIKPLDDYCKIYTINDENGIEYEKTDGEYNWDNIKADLLLGNTVKLRDGNNDVLNYRYEGSTEASRDAEENSVYGNINTAEMLGEGVAAMQRLSKTGVIDKLSSLNKTTKGIIDKIKNTESINIEETIKSIDATMKSIENSLTGADVTMHPDFESRFNDLQNEIKLFKTYLNENNYKELKPAAEVIQEEIGILSSFLINE